MGETQKHMMEKTTEVVDCEREVSKENIVYSYHESKEDCVKKCSSKLITFFSQSFHLPSLYLVALPVSGEGSSTSPG